MEEISWGRLVITLLLPLLAVIWMVFVLRRQAMMSEDGTRAGTAARTAVWIAGFVITWGFATFLGFYLLAQVGSASGAEKSGFLTFLTGFATPYISGLWGALVPYRMLSREGKTSLSYWFMSALAYAVLFYLSTQLF